MWYEDTITVIQSSIITFVDAYFNAFEQEKIRFCRSSEKTVNRKCKAVYM